MVEYSKDRFACEILDGQIMDDKYKVIDEVIYFQDAQGEGTVCLT